MLLSLRALVSRLDLDAARKFFGRGGDLCRSAGALYGLLALLMMLAPLSVRAESSTVGPDNSLRARANQVVEGGKGASGGSALNALQSDGTVAIPALKPAGILFIEGNVADYEQLAHGASPSLEVVVLNAEEDGLKQMADALSGRKNVPAVHLISHGRPGMLDLGSLAFDAEALKHRRSDLARIGAALGANAELLLYGCNVAEGPVGHEFLRELSAITGAHVAGSTNLTGAAEKGGDWVLESRTGTLQSAVLNFATYRHVLLSVAGTVLVNNGGNWVNFGSALEDNEGDNGDIPGVVYQMFFAESSGVASGTVAAFNNGLGSVGTVLILDTSAGAQTNDSSYSFIIKSQAGKFKLTSFLIQDYYGINANYLAKPYLNGVQSGEAYSFTIPQTGGYASTVQLPTQFSSVTEVRITSDGGTAPQPGARNIWQGFNNFVFADPILSTNANLSALSLSSGALAPGFSSGTTSYTASVLSNTVWITVTPTVADTARATVTVNTVSVNNGTASGAIALAYGANVITTVVTSEDGSNTKTYTTTVTRTPPSSNANLSALALSNGTLSPAFAAGTTAYTASVTNATTSLTVTPTVADTTASVTVNGVATTSGNASGAIALAIGSQPISVGVMAEDGTVKTYTVTVTRAGSGDANLSALVLSGGSLSPGFAPSTTSYTMSVAAATGSITVTPTVSEQNSTVTVNGVAVASGTASIPITLNTGATTVTVAVTAQNSSTKTYTVTVTRALSTNNDLAALSVSGGTLNPVFSAAQQNYSATVPNATASVTVTPTVADSSASVTVKGVPVTSGVASGAIALNVGLNPITITVTAQDGSPRNYTLNLTRDVSTNADLSALVISTGILNPVFASATTAYTATVPNATGSVTLTPTAASSTITVNGVANASGAASPPLTLNVGATVLTVVVTAQDGVTTNTYTVTVTRSALPTMATGSSPGGGTVSASLAGPVGCGFERTAFIGLTGSPNSPPASPGIANYTFAQGLFDVEVGACPTSSTVTITLLYPQPFAAGSVYMKYGPTASDPAPHWYVFPGAVVNGNTVTLTLTDGGAGDDDRIANGRIADPGGVALPAAVVPGGATGIPTLSQWALVLLSLLLLGTTGWFSRTVVNTKK